MRYKKIAPLSVLHQTESQWFPSILAVSQSDGCQSLSLVMVKRSQPMRNDKKNNTNLLALYSFTGIYTSY